MPQLRVPIAREGYPFILASLIVLVGVWFAGIWWLDAVFFLLAAFVVAFFRDPERSTPGDDNAIVSPADGLVIKTEVVNEERLLKAQARKISIFMNVFNVHVNRAPASGKVVKIQYNPGRFFSANLDKASLENEQNAVLLETRTGKRIVFNQIAGLIARRIVCRVKPGAALKKGERFGMIRFGSRLDVYLPAECKLSVKVGDKVRAGSSILAYWR